MLPGEMQPMPARQTLRGLHGAADCVKQVIANQVLELRVTITVCLRITADCVLGRAIGCTPCLTMAKETGQCHHHLFRTAIGPSYSSFVERNTNMLSARYCKLLCSVLLLFSSVSTVLAQRGVPHYQHAGALPPGHIGSIKRNAAGHCQGYFQPLELRGPRVSNISLSVENQFSKPLGNTVKAGMLIVRCIASKSPYRQNPGAEVYPTIEVINRLYPPRGQEFQFPIVAEFNLEDLQFALAGKMVTRVIYLENPNAAFPMAIKEQTYFEVKPAKTHSPSLTD